MFRTEFDFTLPGGLPEPDGTLHRDGVMRRATAFDEIAPLRDPRVTANEAYLSIIVLSRVITRLGTVDPITPKVIENLFAGDLAYLQDFYESINRFDLGPIDVTCPKCDHEFSLPRPPGLGE